MVIGVDVHHDTSKKYRSVMGFVASLNRYEKNHYCGTFEQSNGKNGRLVHPLSALDYLFPAH